MSDNQNIANKVISWNEPQPIIQQISPFSYPINELPQIIRGAVLEVQEFTKAPVAMIAASAISTLSLAAQPHFNVMRAEKLIGPIGIYYMTIADSGERKSTCDNFFIEVIRRYENEQNKTGKKLFSEYQLMQESWNSKKDGLKDKIRQESKKRNATKELESELQQLEASKPKKPKTPSLLYADATPEALAYGLRNWPSAGIITSEAGVVFGGHAMNNESIMRNLALLNTLWDGGTIKYDRRSSDSFSVSGARLTMHLQIQHATLKEFINRAGLLARGMGFFARFLFSWPLSTQGTRSFSEAPQNWPDLELFHTRINEILNKEVVLHDNEELKPAILRFSAEGKAMWISLYNHIEEDLAFGKDLYDIRDIASKAADNVARLAALFHVLTNNNNLEIDLNNVQSAMLIVLWHLKEVKRFFEELCLSEELSNLISLDRWLIAYCLKNNTHFISRRDLQRLVTPFRLRKKTILATTLCELERSDRIKQINDDRKKLIYINPKLLN